MNDHDQQFDRLCLFLSSEYFFGYWHLLSSDTITVPARNTIQTVARDMVSDFMKNESCYWNIDFSPSRHQQTRDTFHNRIAKLSTVDLLRLTEMEAIFCQSHQQQSSLTFTLSLLHRLSTEEEYGPTIRLTPFDVDLVATAIPSNDELTLDTYQLREGWLGSDAAWDKKIRNYTPDLPEYVVDNFSGAYENAAELPAFLKGVKRLLAQDKVPAFIGRLNTVIEQQFPEGSELRVPSHLLNAESV